MDDEKKKEENLSRKTSERINSGKKKYRILSQRKRKSCPAIFSVDDNVTVGYLCSLFFTFTKILTCKDITIYCCPTYIQDFRPNNNIWIFYH